MLCFAFVPKKLKTQHKLVASHNVFAVNICKSISAQTPFIGTQPRYRTAHPRAPYVGSLISAVSLNMYVGILPINISSREHYLSKEECFVSPVVQAGMGALHCLICSSSKKMLGTIENKNSNGSWRDPTSRK